MALSAAKMCTKLGLSGGAIYWSIQQGVWGTTQEGSQAMKRLTAAIFPGDGKAIAEPVQNIKPDDNVVVTTWNQGAKTVFEYIRDAPEYAGKAGNSVVKMVNDTFSK